MTDIQSSLLQAGWIQVDWGTDGENVKTGVPIGTLDAIGVLVGVNDGSNLLGEIGLQLVENLASQHIQAEFTVQPLTVFAFHVIHVAVGRRPLVQ